MKKYSLFLFIFIAYCLMGMSMAKGRLSTVFLEEKLGQKALQMMRYPKGATLYHINPKQEAFLIGDMEGEKIRILQKILLDDASYMTVYQKSAPFIPEWMIHFDGEKEGEIWISPSAKKVKWIQDDVVKILDIDPGFEKLMQEIQDEK